MKSPKILDPFSTDSRSLLSRESLRPKTQGYSHPLKYSKAFLCLFHQQNSVSNNPKMGSEETAIKTSTSDFHGKGKRRLFKNSSQTGNSIMNTRASFHSNLFITTKNPPASALQSINAGEKRGIFELDYHNKPVTAPNHHRYQRSTFLDEKILTENFFLPLEDKISFSRPIHTPILDRKSATFIVKAVKTPSVLQSIPDEKREKIPNESSSYFGKFKRNLEIATTETSTPLIRKGFANGRFKIRTMLKVPVVEEIRLSAKESVEKRLIQVGKGRLQFDRNMEIRKTILVVEDTLLDQIRHKTNLKYGFLDLPCFQGMEEIKMKDYSKSLMREIANQFNINAKNLYIYLKSGDPIKDLHEIPENEHTLILSPRTSFSGFYNRNCPNFYKMARTVQIIKELELLLSEYNSSKGRKNTKNSPEMTYESKIRDKYRDLIEDTVKLIESGEVPEDPEKKLRFRTRDEYFDEKNLQETIYETDKLKELEKIEKMYDRNLKKIKFESTEVMDSSDEDYQKVNRRVSQSSSMLMDDFQEKAHKIANKLDKIMTKWLKNAAPPPVKKEPDSLNSSLEESKQVDDNLFAEEDQKRPDLVEENRKRFRNKKRVVEILHKENRELFLQNIPKLMNKTNFTRSEMHSTYILFKVLQQITSQRYMDYSTEEGLDYETFRKGIPQIFHQSEQIAKKIFYTIDFNYSGFLNWEEFLNLMEIIKAKTLKEKIDLFIKIADDDGNGQLSKKEIHDLCRICLEKYIKSTEGEEVFLEEMSSYFTKLIFAAVDIDLEEEIPLEKIKQTILSGNVESDLLCMFCGADI